MFHVFVHTLNCSTDAARSHAICFLTYKQRSQFFSLDKMLSFVKVRKNIFNFKEENEVKSLEIDRNGREWNGTIAKNG